MRVEGGEGSDSECSTSIKLKVEEIMMAMTHLKCISS